MVVTAYPLGRDSLNAEAVRLVTECIPPRPAKPDLTYAGNAERLHRISQWQKADREVTDALTRAQKAHDQFQTRVKARPQTTDAIDLNGFLTLATREIARPGDGRPLVVIVARELNTSSSWCNDCVDLGQVPVVVIGFDGADSLGATDFQARVDQLALILRLADAGDVRVVRSNESMVGLLDQS